MKAEEIMATEAFRKCADFHGHVCPGLALGFQAATAAMTRLQAGRSEDEEIVAIVETDACCADAVQVLTGCTFGKGNFIYKDHGKMVFTFLSRNTGEGVRVSLRPDAFAPGAEHLALIQKIIQGTADTGERERFYQMHHQRTCDVLEMAPDQLFAIDSIQMQLPHKARIAPSKNCDTCGEPTMATKLEVKDGRSLCRDCLSKTV